MFDLKLLQRAGFQRISLESYGPSLSAKQAYDIIAARTIEAAEYKELAQVRNVKRDRGAQHNEVPKYEACAFYGLKELDDTFFLETKAAHKSPFSEPAPPAPFEMNVQVLGSANAGKNIRGLTFLKTFLKLSLV